MFVQMPINSCLKEEMNTTDPKYNIKVKLTVADEENIPLENVLVSIFNNQINWEQNTNPTDSLFTDIEGEIEFLLDSTGTYWFRAFKMVAGQQLFYFNQESKTLDVNVDISENFFDSATVFCTYEKSIQLSKYEAKGFLIKEMHVGQIEDKIWDNGVNDVRIDANVITSFNSSDDVDTCIFYEEFPDTTGPGCDLCILIKEDCISGDLNEYLNNDCIDISPSNYPYIIKPGFVIDDFQKDYYMLLADKEHTCIDQYIPEADCKDEWYDLEFLMIIEDNLIYQKIGDKILLSGSVNSKYACSFYLQDKPLIQFEYPVKDTFCYTPPGYQFKPPFLKIFVEWIEKSE